MCRCAHPSIASGSSLHYTAGGAGSSFSSSACTLHHTYKHSTASGVPAPAINFSTCLASAHSTHHWPATVPYDACRTFTTPTPRCCRLLLTLTCALFVKFLCFCAGPCARRFLQDTFTPTARLLQQICQTLAARQLSSLSQGNALQDTSSLQPMGKCAGMSGVHDISVSVVAQHLSGVWPAGWMTHGQQPSQDVGFMCAPLQANGCELEI